jgi:hypothetical protein
LARRRAEVFEDRRTSGLLLIVGVRVANPLSEECSVQGVDGVGLELHSKRNLNDRWSFESDQVVRGRRSGRDHAPEEKA